MIGVESLFPDAEKCGTFFRTGLLSASNLDMPYVGRTDSSKGRTQHKIKRYDTLYCKKSSWCALKITH